MREALQAFAKRFTPPAPLAGGSFSLPSATGSADAFLAATLADASSGRVILAVTPGLPDADRLADDLRLVTTDTPVRILEFPPPLEGDRSALGLRLRSIAALRAWELSPYPCVVVAAFPALAAPVRAGTVPTRLSPQTGNGVTIGFSALTE